jgi:hypothetical protein
MQAPWVIPRTLALYPCRPLDTPFVLGDIKIKAATAAQALTGGNSQQTLERRVPGMKGQYSQLMAHIYRLQAFKVPTPPPFLRRFRQQLYILRPKSCPIEREAGVPTITWILPNLFT